MIASLAAVVRESANHAKGASGEQRKEQPNVAGNNNVNMQLQAVAAIFCYRSDPNASEALLSAMKPPSTRQLPFPTSRRTWNA